MLQDIIHEARSNRQCVGTLFKIDEGILKAAMAEKYQYNSQEKQDKVWSAIRESINTRGRNLRYLEGMTKKLATLSNLLSLNNN